MKVKQISLVLLAFSALAISGCSGHDDPKPTTSAGHTHTYSDEWSHDETYHWHDCTGCDEITGKEEHKFVESHVDATCDEVEHKLFTCSVCGYTKVEHIGHELKEHSFKVALTKAATCAAEGEYTFTCELCGKSVIQKYSDPEAHDYKEVSTENGVTTYKCSLCELTKTTINASDKTSHSVSTETLKSAGEIELKEASIAFPESAVEQFGSNVTISAEPKSASEISGLSDEVKAQIGNSKIVDFSLKDGDEKVSSFDGSLTISIPYELKAGENPNGIVVWYLDENGNPTQIEAVYRNGSAVFSTNHFSYYAVLHMEPDQLCALFGHNEMMVLATDSTCEAHGSEDYVCTRCGKTRHLGNLPLANHDWVFVEKVDSTHTEEGHLLYQCSVCGEKKETIIPKKSDSERGFYFTFLDSLGKSELHAHGMAITQGNEVYLDGYYGLDNEGVSFGYLTERLGNETEELGFYKGFTIQGYSLSKGKLNESASNVLAKFASISDLVPASVADKVEEVGEFFEKNLLTKKEIPEGYALELNKEAILKHADNFINKTLAEALNGLFGSDFTAKLSAFVARCYDKTVEDALKDFEEKQHIVVKELYEAVKGILALVNEDVANELPEFDKLFTAEEKAMKIIDYLAAKTGMVGRQIPATDQEAQKLLQDYLKMNLLDMLPGSSRGDTATAVPVSYAYSADQKKEIFDMVKKYVEAVDLTLKLNVNGSFISLDVNMKDEGFISDNVYLGETSIQLTVGFDKAPILARLKELSDKADLKDSVFKIGKDNVGFMEQAYGEQFKDVKFDYIQEYNGAGSEYYRYYNPDGSIKYPSALVSKADVSYTIYDYDKESGKDAASTISGKLVIILSNYPYVRVVTNEFGYGSKLAKGEMGVIASTSNLVYGGYIVYKVTSEGGTTETARRIGDGYKEEGLKRAEFLYALDQKKLYTTRGSFDYLTAYDINATYKLLTKDEFLALGGRYTEYDKKEDETYGYRKRVFYACSRQGYTYYASTTVTNTNYGTNGSQIGFTYFVDPAMNDDALEHYGMFGIQVLYDSGSLSYRPRSVVEYDGYESFVTSNGFKVGNAELVLTSKAGTYSCTTVYSWQIKVAGKVVKNGTFNQHSLKRNESKAYHTSYNVGTCEEYIMNAYECEHCKKIYFYDYSYVSHHDFKETTRVNPTISTAGYIISTCSKCGEKNGRIIYPCTHENGMVKDGVFSCPDCGYSIKSDTVPLMGIEKVDSPDSSVSRYAYLFFNVGYWSQEYTTSNYRFYVMVQDTSTGNLVEDENARFSLNPTSTSKELDLKEFGMYDWYQYYYFDIDKAQLSALKAAYPEKSNYKVVVAVISNSDATSFVYSL